MKRISLFVIETVCLICLYVGNAFALQLGAIDGTVSFATDPYLGEALDLGTTHGFGVGVNLLRNTSAENEKYVTRLDLNYYRWSNNIGFVSESHMRMPFFLGRRYFLPWDFYIDGGFEFTYATWKSNYTGPLFGTLSPGSSSKHSDILLGLAAGLGIELPVISNITIGAQARYHLTSETNSTFGVSIGYHF